MIEVRDSGMKRVLRLRDGDSEQGSGMQERQELNWEGHRNETGN